MSTINSEGDNQDIFVVDRGETSSYKVNAGDLMSTINVDTDWLLVNRGDEAFKVSALDVRDQLGGGPQSGPEIATLLLQGPNPGDDRFTNQTYTSYLQMANDGNPQSIKQWSGKVEGDLYYQAETAPISGITPATSGFASAADAPTDDNLSDRTRAFHWPYNRPQDMRTAGKKPTHTVGTTSNLTNWTMSVWMCNGPGQMYYNGQKYAFYSSPGPTIYFDSDLRGGRLNILMPNGSTLYTRNYGYTASDSWTHVMIRYNTSGGQANCKVWINGVDRTSDADFWATPSDQLADTWVSQDVGINKAGTEYQIYPESGLLQTGLVLIDGFNTLTAEDFGTTDAYGNWVPSDNWITAGGYDPTEPDLGVNGMWVEFDDPGNDEYRFQFLTSKAKYNHKFYRAPKWNGNTADGNLFGNNSETICGDQYPTFKWLAGWGDHPNFTADPWEGSDGSTPSGFQTINNGNSLSLSGPTDDGNGMGGMANGVHGWCSFLSPNQGLVACGASPGHWIFGVKFNGGSAQIGGRNDGMYVSYPNSQYSMNLYLSGSTFSSPQDGGIVKYESSYNWNKPGWGVYYNISAHCVNWGANNGAIGLCTDLWTQLACDPYFHPTLPSYGVASYQESSNHWERNQPWVNVFDGTDGYMRIGYLDAIFEDGTYYWEITPFWNWFRGTTKASNDDVRLGLMQWDGQCTPVNTVTQTKGVGQANNSPETNSTHTTGLAIALKIGNGKVYKNDHGVLTELPNVGGWNQNVTTPIAFSMNTNTGTLKMRAGTSGWTTVASDLPTGKAWRPYWSGYMERDDGFDGNQYPTETYARGLGPQFRKQLQINTGIFPWYYPDAFTDENAERISMDKIIADPDASIATFNYMGDGTVGRQIVSNEVSFTPDLLFLHGNGKPFCLYDSAIGLSQRFDLSLANGAANTGLTAAVTSFTPSGFIVGTDDKVNALNVEYDGLGIRVDTVETNTDGSYQSEIRKNLDVAVSIVRWTSTGAAGTIGHGLGQTPDYVMARRVDAAGEWYIWQPARGTSGYTSWTNGTVQSDATVWNNTGIDSTVINAAGPLQATDGEFVAYCFKQVTGVTAFQRITEMRTGANATYFTAMQPQWFFMLPEGDASTACAMSTNKSTQEASDFAQFTGYRYFDTSGNGGMGNQIACKNQVRFNSSSPSRAINFLAFGKSRRGTAPFNKVVLTFDDSTDLDKFNQNDSFTSTGTDAPSPLGIVNSVDIGANQMTVSVSPQEPNFSAGNTILGANKITESITKYLVLDEDMNVTGLSNTQTWYFAGGNYYQVDFKFGATLDTGNSPNYELPAGTKISSLVVAMNTDSGGNDYQDSAESATITPMTPGGAAYDYSTLKDRFQTYDLRIQ